MTEVGLKITSTKLAYCGHYNYMRFLISILTFIKIVNHPRNKCWYRFAIQKCISNFVSSFLDKQLKE